MDHVVFEETEAIEADEKIHEFVNKMFESKCYTQALILQHLRSEVYLHAKEHNASSITLYVGNELGLKITGFRTAQGADRVKKLVLNIIGDTLNIRNAEKYSGYEKVYDQCNNRNEVETKMNLEKKIDSKRQEQRDAELQEEEEQREAELQEEEVQGVAGVPGEAEVQEDAEAQDSPDEAP